MCLVVVGVCVCVGGGGGMCQNTQHCLTMGGLPRRTGVDGAVMDIRGIYSDISHT